jgi:hypothetical protein
MNQLKNLKILMRFTKVNIRMEYHMAKDILFLEMDPLEKVHLKEESFMVKIARSSFLMDLFIKVVFTTI